MQHYDYIFAGCGLSSLMTVLRMLESRQLADKTALLIDVDPKKNNDRTWCYWEKPNGEFDSIISKKWDAALFADKNFRRKFDLEPYQYKMIRGLDFYNFAFGIISQHDNITFLNAEVTSFRDNGDNVEVTANVENFSCGKLFNSIYDERIVAGQSDFPLLKQHFIGWKIKSEKPAFDPETVTFMDFSIPQKGNTRFMYVLPGSETEALVEYTLFSEDLLAENEYESAITDYIAKIGITNYTIVEKERGSIPMTVYPFWKHNTKNILNIGSAGGWTKAATGYTFANAAKLSSRLAEFLANDTNLTKFHHANKFRFYDTLLLDILSERNKLGHEIFASMFRNGSPALILKFLNEETSLAEDFRVIMKCPKRLFLSALVKRIFNS